MSSKRDRKQHKRQAANAERQKIALGYLRRINIWREVQATPLAERLLQARAPKARIVLADDAVSDNEAASLAKDLGKCLKDITFNCPLLGKDSNLQEFFSTVKPMMNVLSAVQAFSSLLPSSMRAALERTEQLRSEETVCDALVALYQQLDGQLDVRNRIDRKLYYFTQDGGRNEHGNPVVDVYLHVAMPRKKRICVDGHDRPAFQCGLPWGPLGLQWLEWDSTLVGRSGGRLPVYVQSHVWQQLQERIGFPPGFEGKAHNSLIQSLREPVLIPKEGQPDHFLVEYRPGGHKLGYSVACLLPESMVLVKTFLFRTMDGTPEGKLLWQNLRLQKQDKQCLGLDSLDVWLGSDIRADRELVDILRACGCGDLLELGSAIKPEELVSGYAEDLRRYVRLNGNV